MIGVCDAVWQRRVKMSNVESFFLTEVVPRYPPQNNNIGSVDPILHNSGKNTLTQQSTDNGERFLAVLMMMDQYGSLLHEICLYLVLK